LTPHTAQNPSRSQARFAVLQKRWSDDPQHVSSTPPHLPAHTPSLQVKPGLHDPSAQQSCASWLCGLPPHETQTPTCPSRALQTSWLPLHAPPAQHGVPSPPQRCTAAAAARRRRSLLGTRWAATKPLPTSRTSAKARAHLTSDHPTVPLMVHSPYPS